MPVFLPFRDDVTQDHIGICRANLQPEQIRADGGGSIKRRRSFTRTLVPHSSARIVGLAHPAASAGPQQADQTAW